MPYAASSLNGLYHKVHSIAHPLVKGVGVINMSSLSIQPGKPTGLYLGASFFNMGRFRPMLIYIVLTGLYREKKAVDFTPLEIGSLNGLYQINNLNAAA